jgi:predicted nuclease of restriction endonuclease-like (RecB) superfamily
VRKAGSGLPAVVSAHGYEGLLKVVSTYLEQARRASVRSLNGIMTATYWKVGRRIVEFEQGGQRRAAYGAGLLARLAGDLSARFGRGFGVDNLERFRLFYLAFPGPGISATASRISDPDLAGSFPLPWSHYRLLTRLHSSEAIAFYHEEALRGGWSVRQLDRQISTQFYERTALSRNKKGMLLKGAQAREGEALTPEEALKEPYVLEFLGLKDEYSESDLEEALIRDLEGFLLELGGDFAFVGRQRRLRVGDEWYRVDLLFYHRRLRCLIIIDLKMGKFTHADAGQMHLYLNYAKEHWTQPGENPPVGVILCAQKDDAVAKYALEGLPNKVMAAQYKTALPSERVLAAHIEQVRRRLARRPKGL